MPVAVSCPCGHRFHVADEDAGRRVACPGCGEPVTAPELGATAPDPTPQPAAPEPMPVAPSVSAPEPAPEPVAALEPIPPIPPARAAPRRPRALGFYRGCLKAIAGLSFLSLAVTWLGEANNAERPATRAYAAEASVPVRNAPQAREEPRRDREDGGADARTALVCLTVALVGLAVTVDRAR
jgi:hypothetical protein